MGCYLAQPEGDGILCKGTPPNRDLNSDKELFENMLGNPGSPVRALEFELRTFEHAIPWQLAFSVTRNCLSGIQSLMNGQV